MRLYGPTGNRSFPTDRSPTTVKSASRQGIVAGGGPLTLATYTVPANRRLQGEVEASAVVTTATGGATTARVDVLLTPNLGTLATIGNIFFGLASPVLTRDRTTAIPLNLAAGDTVTVQLSIDAGIGAVDAHGGIHGLEYDA